MRPKAELRLMAKLRPKAVMRSKAKVGARGLLSLTKYSAIFAEVEGYFEIESDSECAYSLRM